jgi:hypothetical protein
MTEPVRVGEVLPAVVDEAIAQAGPGYDRWLELVTQTGYCAHPVRLRGRVEHADHQTGEVRTVYSTGREPDATLLEACGNRRASVCPTCSATYQADSFQLLAAGLRGGKGIPGCSSPSRPHRSAANRRCRRDDHLRATRGSGSARGPAPLPGHGGHRGRCRPALG